MYKAAKHIFIHTYKKVVADCVAAKEALTDMPPRLESVSLNKSVSLLIQYVI